MSIPYSANRKHKLKEKEITLKKQINLLEQLTQHLNSHNTFQEILDKKKANWIEYGKKLLNTSALLKRGIMSIKMLE